MSLYIRAATIGQHNLIQLIGKYVENKNSLTCSFLLPASSGSDSPDQALEAEEIVKQLDMEQTVETPTSTATSAQQMCSPTTFYSSVSPPPPLRPLAKEEELETDADLPPLTGAQTRSLFYLQVKITLAGVCVCLTAAY